MNSGLVRKDLGALGIAHVRSRLWPAVVSSERDGVVIKTVPLPLRAALAGLPLEEVGGAWTWLPQGVTATEEILREGPGENDEPLQGSDDLMKVFVIDHLSRGNRVAIIEDFEASPSDPRLKSHQHLPPKVETREHVYWYATTPDIDHVTEFMSWGFSLFKCLALTTLTIPWPPQADPVDDQVLMDLAARAEHIVVDAYDFDGFVIWSRAG